MEAVTNQELIPEIRTVSLHDWSIAYLDYAKDRFVEKTYKEKRFAFREFFLAIASDTATAEIDNQVLLKFLQNQSVDRSGYCANKQRKNLRAAWQWGSVFLNLSRENPFDSIQRFAEVRNERIVPTMDEFWKVHSVAESEQDKILLFMYLHTGARRDELFRLRWQDVDFHGKRVLLSSRKNKAGEWESKWLPIGEELIGMLKQHQKITGLLRFVFLNQCDKDPKKWVPFVDRAKWMPRLCKKAEVKPFGVHGIRHLTASLLAGANLPLIAIKEMLRHKSINTTQRYIHSLSEGNREVLSALPCFKATDVIYNTEKRKTP